MTKPLVGLIVPSSNPTIESYLASSNISAYLGVSFLTTRLRVKHIDADEGSSAQFAEEELATAAELLADAEVCGVIWAGTAGFWLGGNGERDRLASVSERIGRPTVSSRDAMLAALAESCGRQLAVLTPYVGSIHQKVLTELRFSGYEIVAHRQLDITDNLSFARIPSEELQTEIAKLGAGGDPVAVVCTNLLGIPPGLDREVFVVDSLLATLWFAARLSGTTTMTYRELFECSRV
jgi:maleate isomerase